MPQKNSKPLPHEFYERPTLKVAKELLEKVLVRETTNSTTFTKIVDAEAYAGPKDKACHASKNRTKRIGPKRPTPPYINSYSSVFR